MMSDPAKEENVDYFEIGRHYAVRTVTMIVTGRLVAVRPTEFIVEDAAWIADTERYAKFITKGAAREIEPYPDGAKVIIGRGALIDMVQVPWDLPRKQK